MRQRDSSVKEGAPNNGWQTVIPPSANNPTTKGFLRPSLHDLLLREPSGVCEERVSWDCFYCLFVSLFALALAASFKPKKHFIISTGPFSDNPLFKQCGLQNSSTCITWDLVRNIKSWAPPYYCTWAPITY